MGKYVNAFIATIVILFIIIAVGVFAYLMIVNPIDTTGKSVSDKDTVKREIPEVCNDVQSTDSVLYPKADECLTLLYLDLYAPCTNGGMSKSESEYCMDKLDRALEQNCKAMKETLGIDREICIVDSLKRVYQQTGGSG